MDTCATSEAAGLCELVPVQELNMDGNLDSFVTGLTFPCLGAALPWTKVRLDQALNEHFIRA